VKSALSRTRAFASAVFQPRQFAICWQISWQVLERELMALAQLSTLAVKNAKSGVLYDGGGLEFHVSEAGVSVVLRFTSPSGQRRCMGLGSLDRSSPQHVGRGLTDARRQAQEARSLLARGLDPIDERRSRRTEMQAAVAAQKAAAIQEQATLSRVARDYHERVIEPTRTAKHSAQWIASLENNVPKELWHAPIRGVTAPQLLDMIATLQLRVPETASRVRQRLEAVFDEAEFRNLATGNPARAIRRKLSELRKGRRVEGHFAALNFERVPALVARIRNAPGIAARALEFGILTASRTAEIIKAEWSEFDLAAGTWIVPSARMKAREEHVVFLPDRALEILKSQRGLSDRYVFPSPIDRAKPISNMGMLTLLRRLKVADRTTVHGLCRSSFSTWAYEKAVARPEVIEVALAHREKDQIKRAYNRAQFNAERRSLLSAWADFVSGSVTLPECATLRAA
jgi:integrase